MPPEGLTHAMPMKCYTRNDTGLVGAANAVRQTRSRQNLRGALLLIQALIQAAAYIPCTYGSVAAYLHLGGAFVVITTT